MGSRPEAPWKPGVGLVGEAQGIFRFSFELSDEVRICGLSKSPTPFGFNPIRNSHSSPLNPNHRLYERVPMLTREYPCSGWMSRLTLR